MGLQKIIWLKFLLTLLLGSAIFAFDISIQLGVAGGVPYVALVLMGLWYSNKSAGLYLGVIASILTIAGYYISPEGGEEWKVLDGRRL